MKVGQELDLPRNYVIIHHRLCKLTFQNNFDLDPAS
jgi:hypothetical protein